MPVYNAAHYLDEAIVTILSQSFKDFELLAINDGSSDNSIDILREYAARDKRVRVIDQQNTGIVGVLNRGINEARADYIARMDSDDISFPRRFEQQVAILDAQPDVVLVCGDFEVIDEDSEFLYRELLPPEDSDIKRAMYLRNPIAHGSVMFRKGAAIKAGLYTEGIGPIEDYDLWARLAKQGMFASTQTALYRWRMNRQGITLSKNKMVLELIKARIDKEWQHEKPAVLSRQQLIDQGTRYWRSHPKYGTDYKNILLIDNSQLAAKLFIKGYRRDGIKQLLNVALTGRTGFKTAMKRLHLIGEGHINKLRRYAKFGRSNGS